MKYKKALVTGGAGFIGSHIAKELVRMGIKVVIIDNLSMGTLNFRLAPTAVQTTVYYPFKGTKLGDECYEKGWVDMERKKRLKLLANDSILNLPGLTRFEIRLAKWINSATALRSGNLDIIKGGFKLIMRNNKSKDSG